MLIRKTALLCALMFAAIPMIAAAAPLPGDVPAKPAAPVKADTFDYASRGIDISWPQCVGNQIPAGEASFVVVGVNGGKAFTRNDCFKQQVDWASTANVKPQLYTNVNGVPAGYRNNVCEAADLACNAYHYGWDSSIDAVGFAESQQVHVQIYWLDVETMNYWTPDKWKNAWTVRGAIEGLQSKGKTVGIYSTPYQWNEVAGQYAPQLPVWTAGAEDLNDARERCSGRYEFGGGKVTLVQYIENNFDTNFACSTMPAQPANRDAQATMPPANTPEPSPRPVAVAQSDQAKAPEKVAPSAPLTGEPAVWPRNIAEQAQLWTAPASKPEVVKTDAEIDPAGASNAQQLRRIHLQVLK